MDVENLKKEKAELSEKIAELDEIISKAQEQAIEQSNLPAIKNSITKEQLDYVISSIVSKIGPIVDNKLKAYLTDNHLVVFKDRSRKFTNYGIFITKADFKQKLNSGKL